MPATRHGFRELTAGSGGGGTHPVRVSAGTSGSTLPRTALLGSTPCTHRALPPSLQLIRNPQPQQCFRANTCSPRGTGAGTCTCDWVAIKARSLSWCLLPGTPMGPAKQSSAHLQSLTQMLAIYLLPSQGPSQQQEADSYQAQVLPHYY